MDYDCDDSNNAFIHNEFGCKNNTFEGGSEEIEEDSKYESDIHADDWFTNSSKRGNYGFWEKYDETHTVIRFATSWATTEENTQKLIEVLKELF